MCENMHSRTRQKISRRDAGWAWVIMISSFVAQLLIDGTISGFGVFFLAMQQDEEFIQANYTRTLLAMPGSIQTGFFLCTGAFVSPLIQRFGFRIMGSLGSVMISFGMALSSLQTNMYFFNLLYGVVAGSGFGILMVCAIVSVNYYFERFRGLASGVAMSGAGVGYLAIPFLFNLLVNRFGWRRSILSYALGIFPLALFSVLTIRPFVVAMVSDEDVYEGDGDLEEQVEVNDEDEITNRPQLQNTDTANRSNNEPHLVQRQDLALPTRLGRPEDVSKLLRVPCTPLDQTESSLEPVCNGSRRPSGTGRKSTDTSNKKISVPFANLIKQFRLPRPGSETLPESSDTQTDVFEEEFGSTVGSRLWKSTQAFKRTKGVSKSHGSYRSSRGKGIGSGDIHFTFSPRKRSNPNERCIILDPFEQVDIFFSASLISLSTRDAHILHRASEVRSSLFNSQIQESTQNKPFQGSGVSVDQSGQLDGVQLQPVHTSRVSFPGLSDKPTQFRPPSYNEPKSFVASLTTFHEADGFVRSDTRPSSLSRKDVDAASIHTGQKLDRAMYFRRRIVSLFDLDLFTKPSFLFILAVGVFNQLAYFIPFVYLVDFATSKGLTNSEAILLLVILGSMHTVGRILAGCAANLVWMDTVHLSGFGSLAVAILHLMLPTIFPVGFAWYGVYAGLFGVACAIPVPMIHILLVRYLGLERLTASYSNLNFAKGIASVIGPLIAVNIVEKTKQTDHYFFVAGACFMLSSVAHLGLCRFPCTKSISGDEDMRARCCIFHKIDQEQVIDNSNAQMETGGAIDCALKGKEPKMV
ncbi:hypothetical protein EG68_03115 [Paragonimus skrjabini miyazakii]|uniref:Monocarboxylate transporter n=1 Tax=Paragonimus skrjabini miyazakii TaxID=59628 RepID=A0A8S9Z2A7_9TREM|nr:hypothetical protein EG68_03115 [Paragonimus skrjabini miyazakii]